eukprot:2356984-Rhodomonas_salina.1
MRHKTAEIERESERLRARERKREGGRPCLASSKERFLGWPACVIALSTRMNLSWYRTRRVSTGQGVRRA